MVDFIFSLLEEKHHDKLAYDISNLYLQNQVFRILFKPVINFHKLHILPNLLFLSNLLYDLICCLIDVCNFIKKAFSS